MELRSWKGLKETRSGFRTLECLLQSYFRRSLLEVLKGLGLYVEASLKVNLEEGTDQELLKSAKDNSDAFEVLYARYYDRVHRRVFVLLYETDLVRDVVNETFVRLMEHRSRLAETDEQLWPWLATVAGNLAKNELRRRSRVVMLHEQRVAFSEPDNDLQNFVEAHAAEIRHAVRLLSPFERTCIRLRYAEGMTTANIARRLEHSTHQVTVALDDAYTVLRQKLAYLSSSRNSPCSRKE